MMKFEGIRVGTKIRAFDFPSLEDRDDMYVEGVIDHVSEEYGYKAYYVIVSKDTSRTFSHRKVVMVPMESDVDYDGRIVIINEKPLALTALEFFNRWNVGCDTLPKELSEVSFSDIVKGSICKEFDHKEEYTFADGSIWKYHYESGRSFFTNPK